MDANNNLNEAEGSSEPSLQSLLARLQGSTALGVSPSARGSAPPAAGAPAPTPDTEQDPSPTVSALLARLRSSPAFTSASAVSEAPPAHGGEPLAPPPPTDSRADAPTLSFQDVLPRLAALGADPTFLDELAKMKREQQDTENKLWMDRLDLLKRQEARVREKRTQAKLVGNPGGLLSQSEATQLGAVFAKELAVFDRDTVLPALDGLRASQRAQLGRMGVPAIDGDDELLGKIMQVLEGLAGA